MFGGCKATWIWPQKAVISETALRRKKSSIDDLGQAAVT
jgi:hypothetical protein